MDDVTIRLRLFAGSWEASAFNEDGQKRKAIHPNQGEAIYQLLRLLNAVDRETMPQPDQYVVPQWVKDCINELIWYKDHVADPGEIMAGTQLARLLTKTVFAEGQGIFSSFSVIQFCSANLKESIKVDFSDLPLTAENFKENLIKRCQRVGQALMDAEKPKPIDPDEGLPSWEEVEAATATFSFEDGYVMGPFGQDYSTSSSRWFTGTCHENRYKGIFTTQGGDFQFGVSSQDSELRPFTVEFLHDLTTDNLATEIPNRIRLVRQARAKALQEAANQ